MICNPAKKEIGVLRYLVTYISVLMWHAKD
jgi:hypothetical protein